MEPATGSTGTGTGSTLLLPTADRGQTSATAPLTPTAPAAPAAARPARTVGRARMLSLALAVDAVVAVLAIVLAVVTLSSAQRSEPDPVTTYPSVGGTLGDHLKQLEDQVSGDWAP